MRPFIYLALVGAACLMLLLPLRAALAPAPGWAASPQAVMAREGRYTQNLRPGETRTYVLEMTGHSLLKVQFSGSGSGFGLRIEDGDGTVLGAVDPTRTQPRSLGVVNPAGTAQTLYLTVYRNGEPSHRRLVRPKGEGERQLSPEEPAPGASQGTYALELARDAMP